MAQMLPLLLLVSFFLLLLVPSFSIRISLTRIDSKLNLTKPELLKRAVHRTKHRIERLSSAQNSSLQTPVQYSSYEYIMDYTIGTPSVPSTGILDTGSDLIWAQCQPCISCLPQDTQYYDPSNSTTFSKLDCSSPLCQALPISNCDQGCNYDYSYGDGTDTQGVMGTETFTFGAGSGNPVSVPGVGFGCSEFTQGDASNTSGIVGLGRGKLSLVSQLGSGMFSYCLTTFGGSSTSPLLLGSSADLNGAVQSTPLIQSPNNPSFYYLSLQGISVGSARLPISSSVFELNSDGSGGLLIDSGTTYTILEDAGYQALVQEFQAQLNLSMADPSDTDFEACFSLPENSSMVVQVPDIVFHFDGADFDIPAANSVVVEYPGLLCLTMLSASGRSTLGNFQQQNVHILYDLNNEKLSFMPAQCDQL